MFLVNVGKVSMYPNQTDKHSFLYIKLGWKDASLPVLIDFFRYLQSNGDTEISNTVAGTLSNVKCK